MEGLIFGIFTVFVSKYLTSFCKLAALSTIKKP